MQSKVHSQQATSCQNPHFPFYRRIGEILVPDVSMVYKRKMNACPTFHISCCSRWASHECVCNICSTAWIHELCMHEIPWMWYSNFSNERAATIAYSTNNIVCLKMSSNNKWGNLLYAFDKIQSGEESIGLWKTIVCDVLRPSQACINIWITNLLPHVSTRLTITTTRAFFASLDLLILRCPNSVSSSSLWSGDNLVKLIGAARALKIPFLDRLNSRFLQTSASWQDWDLAVCELYCWSSHTRYILQKAPWLVQERHYNINTGVIWAVSVSAATGGAWFLSRFPLLWQPSQESSPELKTTSFIKSPTSFALSQKLRKSHRRFLT